MDTIGRFKILLTDLPDDGATFEWHLDDSFFSGLDEQEIQQGDLDATLRVNRKSGAYELNISVQGEVQIPCDRCLEPMAQPIAAETTLKVQLGEAYSDDGELIIVPEESGELDVAWNLYETIALAIPIYHAHPDGGCNDEVNQLFSTDESDVKPTDTRWDALKSLLNK